MDRLVHEGACPLDDGFWLDETSDPSSYDLLAHMLEDADYDWLGADWEALVDAAGAIAGGNRAARRHGESGPVDAVTTVVRDLQNQLVSNLGCHETRLGDWPLDVARRFVVGAAERLTAMLAVAALGRALAAEVAAAADKLAQAGADTDHQLIGTYPPGRLVVASPAAPHGPPASTTAPSSAAVLILAA